MHNINKGKIAIFIDGNNLFHIAQQLNIEIDYTKLMKYILGNYQYYKAYFYGISDSNNDKQQGFYTWLKYNGYKVITKSHYNTFNSNNSINDDNGDKNKKYSLDVEITMDLIKMCNKFDTAIIVGGSSDLLSCMQFLSQKGIRLEWVNLKSNTTNVMNECVDYYIDINDIKINIEKQNGTNYEKYNNILSQYKN